MDNSGNLLEHAMLGVLGTSVLVDILVGRRKERHLGDRKAAKLAEEGSEGHSCSCSSEGAGRVGDDGRRLASIVGTAKVPHHGDERWWDRMVVLSGHNHVAVCLFDLLGHGIHAGWRFPRSEEVMRMLQLCTALLEGSSLAENFQRIEDGDLVSNLVSSQLSAPLIQVVLDIIEQPVAKSLGASPVILVVKQPIYMDKSPAN
mmetsp:Transcript_13132/g.30212  ORF Transcript_13132/g.30212 Transcript_13132/m.30212 type:complete len:202 (+) Transcript_13132:151-756(+)